ncbi:hypothetical protein [Aestuariibaculum sediminum]|uniref:Uncharacterized protein n=1 Tax=Aestuariibaculum sediminum TaxID=2770637 RepID=A0A8J6UE75_9FLAO|nr:hypothetical protein [Aestuariibaculum sediminum]MBD0833699.1 hypothetical protein [Aestuariibaculum sediminum]
MKNLKHILILILILTFNGFCYAQMYRIHQDNVKPSKIEDYEKTAKEFKEACVKHEVDASWAAASSDDFKFIYISEIENMAALDERPFADMAEAMGDKFGKLFEDFDKCYDSHTTYIIHLVKDLSYMPKGLSMIQEGQDYRTWYYIYFTPQNAKKIREGMEAVKKLYETKNSKEYYRVYRNGFGTQEECYLVAVSSKDAIHAASKSKENEKVLGPDRWDTFKKVMDYAERLEEVHGRMRPDLSYNLNN